LATHQDLKAIEQRVKQVVEDAVAFAEQSPEPSPSELRRYLFAED
jgi:pyruvate dehydrogenase E1 component alpha subunit